MNWHRIRKWLCILILLCTIGTLIASWLVGSSLVAPANRTVGPPPDDFSATSIQFASESGSEIAAWHLLVPDSKSTVILFHPLRGDRRSMLSRASVLRARGYSTLLVDLQAHGESTGEKITLGHLEKHDVNAAVQFVRTQSPGQKIAIIGWSLGGAATLFANPRVDAIVLESVYPTVTEAVHERVKIRLGPLHHVVAPLLLIQLKPRLDVTAEQLQPIDHLQNIACPVLIATGDQDRHTPIDQTRRMFDLAAAPKHLVIFEGAEHEDLFAYDSSKYENEIIGFIDNTLE